MRSRHHAAIARIKAALFNAGLTCAAIDRDYGLYTNQASDALYEPNAPGEHAVAAALRTRPEMLWPHRYDENGARFSPQPRSNYRMRSTGIQRPNGREARP